MGVRKDKIGMKNEIGTLKAVTVGKRYWGKQKERLGE